MPTAVVVAAFDAATDAAVLAAREIVREIVREARIPLRDRPPQRPHFSLAAARVTPGPELERVLALTSELAGRHGPVEVPFDHVGRFGRAGVVWLGPRERVPALDAVQADADATLRASGWPRAFGEHSDPARWVAHCTLATRIDKPLLRRVQARVAAAHRPVSARVDALAVILVGGSGDLVRVPLSA